MSYTNQSAWSTKKKFYIHDHTIPWSLALSPILSLPHIATRSESPVGGAKGGVLLSNMAAAVVAMAHLYCPDMGCHSCACGPFKEKRPYHRHCQCRLHHLSDLVPSMGLLQTTIAFPLQRQRRHLQSNKAQLVLAAAERGVCRLRKPAFVVGSYETGDGIAYAPHGHTWIRT